MRLTLATATGGLTISPGADFSMDFGSVNGLGFSPSAGLTTVAATGGVVYSTPYLLQPAFSAFTLNHRDDQDLRQLALRTPNHFDIA